MQCLGLGSSLHHIHRSLCPSADGKIYVFEKDARTVRVVRDGGGGCSVASLPSSWLHATGASPCASGIIVCDRCVLLTQI
jgi:hypothetical protein